MIFPLFLFGSRSKSESRGAPLQLSSFYPPAAGGAAAAAAGSTTCGPPGKVGSGMYSGPAGEGWRAAPRQAHDAMGNEANNFQASWWGQYNPLDMSIPCCGGQGTHCRPRLSCLNKGCGIWPRADEPDTEPDHGTLKRSLSESLKSSLMVKTSWKNWNRGRKGKDEERTVPSVLVGFDW